jgi:hypothetical protein
MSDQNPWEFWAAQLAGENPPLPPEHGKPVWGFYLLRQRYTWAREEHEKKIGTRNKVATHHWPVALWEDETGWHCVITRAPQGGKDYRSAHLTDPVEIDEQIVSRCCRAAITHDDYLAKVKELENSRERVSTDQAVEHDDVDRSAQFG